MQNKIGINNSGRLLALISIALISSVLMLMVSTLARAEVEAVPFTVTKSVTGGTLNPGGTIEYTIVISPTGDGAPTNFTLTDTLPISTTYVPGSIQAVNAAGISLNTDNGVITSASYPLIAGNTIQVSFMVTIAEDTPLGTMITNTVDVEDIGNTLMLSDTAVMTVQELSEPVDLFVDKTVTGGDMLPGGTLEYSIVVTTSAAAVRNFVLTDTLPAGLTYIPNSLQTTAGFSMAESGGELVSTEYFLNPGTMVEATFAVTIDASTAVSTVITNTVMMNDKANAVILADSVAATVITMTRPSTYYINMPVVFTSFPAPVLNSIVAPTGTDNKWTVSWADMHTADTRITGYQIEEATDPGFTQNVVLSSLGKVTTLDVTKPIASSTVTYYYRVRIVASGSPIGLGVWSNTQAVVSIFTYEDTFSDTSNPTNWRIVRQDTDTVDNTLSIKSEDPGYLDLRMKSRFDYMMGSDLTELPVAPYKLTARMRLEDADPRHTGGIILGGDYDGTSDCPKDITNGDFSSCFTKYYRFLFIAGNTPSQMQVSVKKITEHASDDNSGSGDGLGSADLNMNSATTSSWIEWTIEVAADGTMLVRRDGSEVLTVKDTELQNNRYFAFWSSTSDTSFSNTQIDWVKVEKQ